MAQPHPSNIPLPGDEPERLIPLRDVGAELRKLREALDSEREQYAHALTRREQENAALLRDLQFERDSKNAARERGDRLETERDRFYALLVSAAKEGGEYCPHCCGTTRWIDWQAVPDRMTPSDLRDARELEPSAFDAEWDELCPNDGLSCFGGWRLVIEEDA